MSAEAGPVQEIVVFGEVLFDRFPDGSQVMGGAPFNVAWNLKALGADPLFISRVGQDALGVQIGTAMEEWGMRTAGLQRDGVLATGTVEVALEEGEPVFDIVADRAYDHILAEDIPEITGSPLLYHGTLAGRSVRSRQALEGLVERFRPSIFFDVNLRPPWWERDRVQRRLETAAEVKMNQRELQALAPAGGGPETAAPALLSRFAIQRLYVTRGEAGALVYTAGGECRQVRPRGEVSQVDPVGAGDAFSSVLILGRLRCWPLERTLRRAQEFAAAVVGLRGALTREKAFYTRFRKRWSPS